MNEIETLNRKKSAVDVLNMLETFIGSVPDDATAPQMEVAMGIVSAGIAATSEMLCDEIEDKEKCHDRIDDR